eukprot:PhF_6_TR4996/c0_g1_i2/m.7073/K07565/NIP7; 60S ribosome subunit biogenesis protein NIP7
MRPLTTTETTKLFAKLAKYIGTNTTQLIDRSDEEWVFRVHNKRVWYLPSALEKVASQIQRKHLTAAGICIARVTHHGNIRIVVTALPIIAQYAFYKVWVKPNQEQSFVYANNLTRGGLGRVTENTPQHQGAAVFSMNDIAMGFGVTALSTLQCRRCENNSIVMFHEADIGEFIRNEDNI